MDGGVCNLGQLKFILRRIARNIFCIRNTYIIVQVDDKQCFFLISFVFARYQTLQEVYVEHVLY